MSHADYSCVTPVERFFKDLDALANSPVLRRVSRILPPFVWLLVDFDPNLIRATFEESDLAERFATTSDLLDQMDEESPEYRVIDEALEILWTSFEDDEDPEA